MYPQKVHAKYGAPELLAADGSQSWISFASDVYSFGRMAEHLGLAQDEGVSAVITQCCAQDPSDRPSLKEIEGALLGEGQAEDVNAVAQDPSERRGQAEVKGETKVATKLQKSIIALQRRLASGKVKAKTARHLRWILNGLQRRNSNF